MPWGSRTQATNNPPKPRATSFFPLRKLKGNQPILKKPAVHLAHLEEEGTRDDEDQESDDPGEIKGVMEEFIVHLARAIKDAQADEKCCYHCSSTEHFICNCPLVKTSRGKKQSNGKEGMALMKGAQTPPMHQRAPRQRLLRCKNHPTDYLLESRPISALAQG